MGKIKLILICFALMYALAMASSVYAEIIISQPNAVYNLGDDFSSTINLGSIKPGYLDIDLICSEQTSSMYHNVPDSTSITIKRKLTPLYIGDLEGSCYLSSSYAGEQINGATFKISNNASVSIEINNITLNVKDKIIIKGTASKENGQLMGDNMQAFVKVFIGDNILLTAEAFSKGKFALNSTIPEKLKAGTYTLLVQVYEVDSENNILNKGDYLTDINVNQKPAKIDLAIEQTLINPGEDIKIIPVLYDFAGDVLEAKIILKINTSQGNLLYEGYADSNKEIVFQTESNRTPGDVIITGQKDKIYSEKTITIKELSKVKAEIKNSSLIITNNGNVPYSKSIEVQIGEESILKELNLQVGESIIFELSAPDGAYDVYVRDDSDILSENNVPLTGAVIGLQEVGDKINNLFERYPIVWVFLVIVIIGLIYAMYMRRKNRNNYLPSSEIKPFKGREFKKEKNIEVVAPVRVEENKKKRFMENKEEKINIRGEIKTAEQALDIHGSKQNSGIIAIKIKNGPVSGIASDNIEKSLEYAYKNKGVVYRVGNYILIIFSPLLTRTFKNEDITIKTALDMEGFLREHNRKFKDKIDYGIGVNSGDLISKIEKDVLKFASIDKTLSLARKIADMSIGEVLLSKAIHVKTMNNVKAEKNNTPGIDTETFRIKRIVNNEESRKFIDDFLKRN